VAFRRWVLELLGVVRSASRILLIAVSTRNLPGVGYRLLGLRRVDVCSGGPVTIRSAVIYHLSQRVWSWATLRVSAPARERASQRMTDLRPQLDEIERQHAGDPQARDNAVGDLYKRENVSCLTPVIWSLSASLTWPLSSLPSRSHQTIGDRLSRTVIARYR
jgi:hypothetical protein